MKFDREKFGKFLFVGVEMSQWTSPYGGGGSGRIPNGMTSSRGWSPQSTTSSNPGLIMNGIGNGSHSSNGILNGRTQVSTGTPNLRRILNSRVRRESNYEEFNRERAGGSNDDPFMGDRTSPPSSNWPPPQFHHSHLPPPPSLARRYQHLRHGESQNEGMTIVQQGMKNVNIQHNQSGKSLSNPSSLETHLRNGSYNRAHSVNDNNIILHLVLIN